MSVCLKVGVSHKFFSLNKIDFIKKKKVLL